MELLFIVVAGFSLGISGAMIPGPLTLYTVSEVVKTNGFAAIRIIIGHILLEAVLVIVILQGFQRFLVKQPFLFWISTIGALALAIMGMILLVNVRKMTLSNIAGQTHFSRGLILGGIFFSAVSPGFLMWWATIGVSSIMRSLLFGISGLTLIMLGHWLADIAWYGFLSFMVDRGKMYLSDRSYRNIIRFFACVLILLGVFFAISSPTSR